MFPNLQTMGIVAIISAMLGASAAWTLTASYKDASWMASINQQKVEAAALLRATSEKALAIERAQALAVTHMEAAYADTQKQLHAERINNLDLATELGGLRDPGRRPRGNCSMPSVTASSFDDATTSSGSELSAEATRFLLDLAFDADQAALYAQAGYNYARVIPPTVGPSAP